MTIALFRKSASEALQPLYDKQEAYKIIDILLEEYFSYSASLLHTHRNRLLETQEEHALAAMLSKLKEGMPLQLVLGKAWFFDLHIHVNNHTLIPRPETEELVNWVVEENLNNDGLSIVDIGTGSGCIALALKKFLPYHEIIATDISHEALAIAQQNADMNKLDISFFQGDILDPSFADYPTRQFDIIVSNPPYITKGEQDTMHANVLKFEPHLALFVPDNNALLFYDSITDYCVKNTHTSSKVYFEINENLGNEMKEMLKNKGFQKISLKKDMSGKARMIRAVFQR